MKTQHDFKKDWEKTKQQLIKFSKEAAELAKKGEKEIIKFSHRSKIHIDSTAINLKKERLFYLIGKEYVKSKNKDGQSAKLNKLFEELKTANSQQRTLKSQLKTAK